MRPSDTRNYWPFSLKSNRSNYTVCSEKVYTYNLSIAIPDTSSWSNLSPFFFSNEKRIFKGEKIGCIVSIRITWFLKNMKNIIQKSFAIFVHRVFCLFDCLTFRHTHTHTHTHIYIYMGPSGKLLHFEMNTFVYVLFLLYILSTLQQTSVSGEWRKWHPDAIISSINFEKVGSSVLHLSKRLHYEGFSVWVSELYYDYYSYYWKPKRQSNDIFGDPYGDFISPFFVPYGPRFKKETSINCHEKLVLTAIESVPAGISYVKQQGIRHSTQKRASSVGRKKILTL